MVILWTPSFVAQTYTSSLQPINFIARPDKGWQFLYDSVRLSRHAKLGTESSALWAAQRRFQGIHSVELVYLEEPVTIPTPRGTVQLPERLRRVKPFSRLTWVAYGHVGGRPRQIVALFDYSSGKMMWDLRRMMREIQ